MAGKGKKEKLLLLIGKGQAELLREGDRVRPKEYRAASYFRADRPGKLEEAVTTPFVGEAILKLYPERFSHVHIFGTRDAMWDILYYHCCVSTGADLSAASENTFVAISEAVGERRLAFGDRLLDAAAEAFSVCMDGIECGCHLIELGTTPDELWEIFRTMTDPKLELEGYRISIDITHSLRFHPLFFIFVLNYFQAVSRTTDFGSIFYGALELMRDHGGNAPIYDLHPFIEMMQWIDAAQAFERYGDADPAALLLPGNLKDLVRAMKGYSQVLELNAAGDIGESAKVLKKRLDADAAKGPAPLELIAPRLMDFPGQLVREKTDWRLLLRVSRHHFQNGKLGLSVLSAWEAAIERLAGIYEVKARQIDNYKRLSALARKQRLKQVLPEPLQEFPDRMRRLSKFRNAIAHAEQCSPGIIAEEFPGILIFLEKHLKDDVLKQLPAQMPWNRL